MGAAPSLTKLRFFLLILVNPKDSKKKFTEMNFKSSKEMSTLVLDPGSGYTKAGLALDEYECVVDSTLFARG